MTATDRRRASILVIDDEPSILNLTRDLLAEEGYRVVATASHDEALTALGTFRFALILSDTGEGFDRWAEPERIRDAAGDTPVIIFSAHDAHLFEQHAAPGFAGTIAKPFHLDELLEKVRATLTRQQRDAQDPA